MTTPSAPPTRRSLAIATLAALGLAAVILVLFILPAEYGVDPTGVGAALGLKDLDGMEPSDRAPADDVAGEAAALANLATFTSSFPSKIAAVLQQDGYLAESDTILIPFQLTQANVSKVTLRIEFMDANTTPGGQRTRPDLFEIELKAPHGDVSGGVLARSDVNSGGGRAEAVYEIRRPPHPRDIEARSLAEARDAFEKNDPADTTLHGEWRARITMVEAGDGEAQGIPFSSGPAGDTGNDWKITVSIQTYSLVVTEKPGTRQRSDSVTLTIPAGGELEYKLGMTLGKRVDHSWRTDGPALYVDFHVREDRRRVRHVHALQERRLHLGRRHAGRAFRWAPRLVLAQRQRSTRHGHAGDARAIRRDRARLTVFPGRVSRAQRAEGNRDA